MEFMKQASINLNFFGELVEVPLGATNRLISLSSCHAGEKVSVSWSILLVVNAGCTASTAVCMYCLCLYYGSSMKIKQKKWIQRFITGFNK